LLNHAARIRSIRFVVENPSALRQMHAAACTIRRNRARRRRPCGNRPFDQDVGLERFDDFFGVASSNADDVITACIPAITARGASV